MKSSICLVWAALLAFATADLSLGSFPSRVELNKNYTLTWTATQNYTYTLWLVHSNTSAIWNKVQTIFSGVVFHTLEANYTWTVPQDLAEISGYGLWLDGLAMPMDGTGFAQLTNWFAVSPPSRGSSTSTSSQTSTPSATTSSSASQTAHPTASPSTSSVPSEVHHSSLSGGAIAGVVIGILVLFALIAVAAVLLMKRRRVLAFREREATARANRLAPVMQEGDPSYEMQSGKPTALHKETVV